MTNLLFFRETKTRDSNLLYINTCHSLLMINVKAMLTPLMLDEHYTHTRTPLPSIPPPALTLQNSKNMENPGNTLNTP